MKIQAIELRERRRVDLGASAPLSKPLALYVEPTSLCNMRCTFCPTGDSKLRRIRPNGFMDFSILEKLVEDLRAWGVELHRVNLYKDGEPLLPRDRREEVGDVGRVEVPQPLAERRGVVADDLEDVGAEELADPHAGRV